MTWLVSSSTVDTIEHMFVSSSADDALTKISEGLEELLAAGLEPVNARSAINAIKKVESVGRRIAAAQADLVDAIDQRGQYAVDGHASAKVMVRHVAKLSAGEAAAREKSAKVMRELPELAERFRGGELGVDQVRLLGRVHANPRVRPHMAEAERFFIRAAKRHIFPDYQAAVQRWAYFADPDGPEPRAQRDRRASIRHDEFGHTWELEASFSSLAGVSIKEIFDRYTRAELLADWEKARAEHGDAATAAHLPRTAAQRASDAMWQIFQDAADNPRSAVPVKFVHNVVWHAESLEELIARFAGAPARPIDVAKFRCSTIDGVPIDPREALASAFIDDLRRVVMNARSMVIDQGEARAFTGSSRLAVLLGDERCTHPGCWVPASQCQIDHTQPHAGGGLTNPGNGGPKCQRHNLFKERGFTVWRDPTGEWHTYRPDGSEIE